MNKIKVSLILGILLTGLSLRLYHLGAIDFWYDEITSIWISGQVPQTYFPPIYYSLLSFWLKLFKASEFNLRFLSLIFSTGAIFLVYLLGKRLFDFKVGMIAGVIIACSSFHIWYAQEACPYSLAVFLSLLATLLFLEMLKSRKIIHQLLFILIAGLGVYTHYFFIWFLLIYATYLLFVKNENKFIVFSSLLIVSTLSLPLVLKFLSSRIFSLNEFWIPEPKWSYIFATLNNFNLGYTARGLNYFIANILSAVLAGYAVWAIFKTDKKTLEGGMLCAGLFVIPIICSLILSKIFSPFYLSRYLILFSPFYYLLIGLGLSKVKPLVLKLGLAAVGLFLLFSSILGYFVTPERLEYNLGVPKKAPFKSAVAFVKENIDPRDLVVHTTPASYPVFVFYFPDDQKRRYQAIVDFPKAITQYYLINRQLLDKYQKSRFAVRALPAIDLEDFIKWPLDKRPFNKLWVIVADWERDGKLDSHSRGVIRELDHKFRLDLVEKIDGLWIFRYNLDLTQK